MYTAEKPLFDAKFVVHAHVPHEFRKFLCIVSKQSGCTCREMDITDLNYRKPHNYTTHNKVLHVAQHTLLATGKFRKTKYHFVSYGLYEDHHMFQITIKLNNACSCKLHSPKYTFTFMAWLSTSSVICQTAGPKPLAKRFIHIVRSRASSFNSQYPLPSLRSSSNFLRLLPCLLVTSICPFIFPSITCFRRQFLRKM